MKRLLVLCLLFCVFALSTGFKEVTRIIKVNPDGTGVIHVRVLFNPKLLDENAKVFDLEKVKAEAGKLGTGVKYVAAKAITSEQTNWKGYIAKYSFYDIKELEIRPASLPSDIDVEEFEDELAGWKFIFKKPDVEGGTASLKIIPANMALGDDDDDWEDDDDDGWEDDDDDWEDDDDDDWEDDDDDDWEDDDDDDDEDGDWAGDDDDDDPEERLQQRGRRYVTYVQVQGEVTKTDPEDMKTLQSKKMVNTITINDEQWEVMWTNPTARKYMKMENRNLAPLIGRKIAGFRTVNRKITVLFR